MLTYPKGKLTFRGGTHPPESKQLSEDCKIEPGPAPKQVAIMLAQHIGAIGKPTVSKNDSIQAGQKIGDSQAFVSAPVHSPVNGKVKQIELRSHPVLARSLAIVIDADPENNPPQNLEPQIDYNFDPDSFTSEQICDIVHQAGIVGMGGAGFPTRVKIAPDERMPKHTMIINGCECEPYITCDYRMMIEKPKLIIAGIKLVKKASGCTKVFIGIENNKPQAIKTMTEELKNSPGCEDIKVLPIITKYPQGGERQLINAVLGKTVPTGGIPPMIGLLVLNIATTAAIAKAVLAGTPLTHRVVTVSGEGIAKPGNYYTPIGTTVGEMIEFSGGLTKDAAKIILGGPMMGFAVSDMQTPLTKTSGAITVLTKKQIGLAKFYCRQTPCIRCGRCLEVCPEHLNPTVIAHAVKNEYLEVAQKNYISACIECGCCSYVCPANIEISGHIKTGKIIIARQNKRIPQ